MRRNVLDTVEDHAVFVAEDDVAVLAHQFYDQELLTGIAHLIAVFQLKFYNTFHAGLADTADAGTADMLAEKHTEVRRGERAWFVFASKIDQRKRSTGRVYSSLFCPSFLYVKAVRHFLAGRSWRYVRRPKYVLIPERLLRL